MKTCGECEAVLPFHGKGCSFRDRTSVPVDVSAPLGVPQVEVPAAECVVCGIGEPIARWRTPHGDYGFVCSAICGAEFNKGRTLSVRANGLARAVYRVLADAECDMLDMSSAAVARLEAAVEEWCVDDAESEAAAEHPGPHASEAEDAPCNPEPARPVETLTPDDAQVLLACLERVGMSPADSSPTNLGRALRRLRRIADGASGPEWAERVKAVVDQAHAENWGGKHREEFCEACADAQIVAQYAVPDFSPPVGERVTLVRCKDGGRYLAADEWFQIDPGEADAYRNDEHTDWDVAPFVRVPSGRDSEPCPTCKGTRWVRFPGGHERPLGYQGMKCEDCDEGERQHDSDGHPLCFGCGRPQSEHPGGIECPAHRVQDSDEGSE